MDNNYNVLQLVVVLNILLLTPQRIVYYVSIITGSLFIYNINGEHGILNIYYWMYERYVIFITAYSTFSIVAQFVRGINNAGGSSPIIIRDE